MMFSSFLCNNGVCWVGWMYEFKNETWYTVIRKIWCRARQCYRFGHGSQNPTTMSGLDIQRAIILEQIGYIPSWLSHYLRLGSLLFLSLFCFFFFFPHGILCSLNPSSPKNKFYSNRIAGIFKFRCFQISS